MSFVVKLIIAGWIVTFVMIGFCALNESGKLLKIRKRIAILLESLAHRVLGTREEGLQPDVDDMA